MSNEMKDYQADTEAALIRISESSDGAIVDYDPSRGMYRVRIYDDDYPLFIPDYEVWFDAYEPMPKKPLLIDGRMKCPRCKMNDRSLHHYCDICGQAIDWSDPNEKISK